MRFLTEGPTIMKTLKYHHAGPYRFAFASQRQCDLAFFRLDTMLYPNLRYRIPTEMAHYAMGVPVAVLAKRLRLRRDERTVRDWLTGRRPVPWWVPEILRLKHMESDLRHRQMGMGALPTRLGVVSADVLTLAQPTDDKKPRESPGLFVDQVDRIISCA
jgi:hypothetical protein